MLDLTPLVAEWPVPTVAVGVTDPEATLGLGGASDWVAPIASVSKPIAAYAGLVALEEGTIALDEPAGPEGSTVRHLLAHASGLSFDEHRTITGVGRRRVYSNAGIEQFADHLTERAGMPFTEYLDLAVFEPLGMRDSTLQGSPAAHIHSSVADLLVFAREVMAPTLVSSATVATATSPHFSDLRGVVPGLGSFDPNPWGLGFEIKGGKHPHWTGSSNAPETFGHFGGSGTFLWIDPSAGLAAVALTDRAFDAWALEVWPKFSDSVLDMFQHL